jgi:hypothetical protein
MVGEELHRQELTPKVVRLAERLGWAVASTFVFQRTGPELAQAVASHPGVALLEVILEAGDISDTLRTFTRNVGATPPPDRSLYSGTHRQWA